MYVMPCVCGRQWYTTRKNLRRGADRICQDDKGGGCGRELPPPKPEPGHVEDVGLGETLPASHFWDYSLGACAAFHGYAEESTCRRCFWPEDAHPGTPVHREPVLAPLETETTSPVQLLLENLDDVLEAAKKYQAEKKKQDAYRSSGMVNLFD